MSRVPPLRPLSPLRAEPPAVGGEAVGQSGGRGSGHSDGAAAAAAAAAAVGAGTTYCPAPVLFLPFRAVAPEPAFSEKSGPPTSRDPPPA